jgi:ubiquinone/menaquinone biosynthesis C-methylase UbiE
MNNPNKDAIFKYYRKKESRLGYRYLLGGTRHYGFYPSGKRDGLSLKKAQRLMEYELGSVLGLAEGSKVLDAGCGEGQVAIFLTKNFGYKVTGVDIFDVTRARKRVETLGDSGPKFLLGDYNSLPFNDNTFDGAYTMETLVHSPNVADSLKELRRVLKPGGILVNFEYSLNDELTEEEYNVWRHIFEGGAMSQAFFDFRRSNMRSIWQKSGFNEIIMREITQEALPTAERFYQLAWVPYQICKLFGVEKKYINTYTAIESYRHKTSVQYWIIKSTKPTSS